MPHRRALPWWAQQGSSWGQALIAGISAAVHLTLAVAYAMPDQLVRRTPLPPGQVSIVSVIEAGGPFITLLFLVSGGGLLLAAITRRGAILAHIVAAGAAIFYSATLAIGSLLSHPPGPIIAVALSVAMVLLHWQSVSGHLWRQAASEGVA